MFFLHTFLFCLCPWHVFVNLKICRNPCIKHTFRTFERTLGFDFRSQRCRSSTTWLVVGIHFCSAVPGMVRINHGWAKLRPASGQGQARPVQESIHGEFTGGFTSHSQFTAQPPKPQFGAGWVSIVARGAILGAGGLILGTWGVILEPWGTFLGARCAFVLAPVATWEFFLIVWKN